MSKSVVLEPASSASLENFVRNAIFGVLVFIESETLGMHPEFWFNQFYI